ncbi:Uncharacterised protein [Halioglobus japonicus]|nr:Uncharacterised protein [Halioglobus japonicus]
MEYHIQAALITILPATLLGLWLIYCLIIKENRSKSKEQHAGSSKGKNDDSVHALKRDGLGPLEFRGRRVADLSWPWSKNSREDTDIICRMALFESESGKWIAGHCRYNLQVMVRNPSTSTEEVFHDAMEFGSLEDAIKWLEKGELGRETFLDVLSHIAQTDRQFVVDRLLKL